MNNWPPFVPYLILAAICCVTSAGIAFISLLVLSNGGHVSDTGMIAFAGMVGAPAVLGIGIAAFMPPDKR